MPRLRCGRPRKPLSGNKPRIPRSGGKPDRGLDACQRTTRQFDVGRGDLRSRPPSEHPRWVRMRVTLRRSGKDRVRSLPAHRLSARAHGRRPRMRLRSAVVAQASGTDTSLVGKGAPASAANATALGNNAAASATGATAVGRGSAAAFGNSAAPRAWCGHQRPQCRRARGCAADVVTDADPAVGSKGRSPFEPTLRVCTAHLFDHERIFTGQLVVPDRFVAARVETSFAVGIAVQRDPQFLA